MLGGSETIHLWQHKEKLKNIIKAVSVALPRHLAVLGDVVKIKQAETKAFSIYEEANEDILGLALVLEDSILIRKDVPESHKRKILAHEIFHIVCYKSGISQSIPAGIEENLCQLFSQIYFQLKKQGL